MQRLQAAVANCRTKLDQLKSVSKLLNQCDIPSHYRDALNGRGTDRGLKSYLQQLWRIRQECKAAATVDAVPSETAIWGLVSMRDSLMQRAESILDKQSNVHKLKSAVQSIPTELGAASASLMQEIDGILESIQRGDVEDVKQLQTVVGECARKVNHLKGASGLLVADRLPADLLQSPAAHGVRQDELDCYLERIVQMREQCTKAGTVDAMSSAGDILDVLNKRSSLKDRMNDAMHVRSRVNDLKSTLESLPMDLALASASLRQELDDALKAMEQGGSDSVTQARKRVDSCSKKLDNLKAASRLVTSGDIPSRLQRLPEGQGLRQAQVDSYMGRLQQMRAQCTNATTVDALPSERDMSRLLSESGPIQRSAESALREHAGERVEQFLRERRQTEQQWTRQERDAFIRQELARFNFNPDSPRPTLLEAYAAGTDPTLTSELVIALRAVTDRRIAQSTHNHLPPGLPQRIPAALKDQLAYAVRARGHEPWELTRDEMIMRFIGIGLDLASGYVGE